MTGAYTGIPFARDQDGRAPARCWNIDAKHQGGDGFCTLIRPPAASSTPQYVVRRTRPVRSIWLLSPLALSPFPFPHSPTCARWLSPPLLCPFDTPILRKPSFAPCSPSSQLRRRPRPTLPTRMENPGTRSPRLCRAGIVANTSGQSKAASQSVSSILHIDLHCRLILGVWSMSNDMREPIQRRSPLPVAGLAVGKHLDDGELILPLPLCAWTLVVGLHSQARLLPCFNP